MAWSFSDEESARSVIEQIKSGKISNKSTAYGILTQIINDLPGTNVAYEARILRDSL